MRQLGVCFGPEKFAFLIPNPRDDDSGDKYTRGQKEEGTQTNAPRSTVPNLVGRERDRGQQHREVLHGNGNGVLVRLVCPEGKSRLVRPSEREATTCRP